MRSIPLFIAGALLAWPTAAAAEGKPVPSPSDERRLSAEQVEAILAEAAARREAAAPPTFEQSDEEESPAIPQVHGEVGFAIGTGGYREAFGTSIYPLGDDSAAAISLNVVDWGHHRRFRH